MDENAHSAMLHVPLGAGEVQGTCNKSCRQLYLWHNVVYFIKWLPKISTNSLNRRIIKHLSIYRYWTKHHFVVRQINVVCVKRNYITHLFSKCQHTPRWLERLKEKDNWVRHGPVTNQAATQDTLALFRVYKPFSNMSENGQSAYKKILHV